jgi:hypothetical protein
MKALLIFAFFICAIFFSKGARAEGYRHECRIQPRDIPVIGTRAIKAARADKASLDDSLLIQSNFSGRISDSESEGELTIEGYFRPMANGFYPVLPLPLFGFEFSRAKDVIYVCAHITPDPAKQEITVYFLRGSQMDPPSIGTIFQDVFSKPEMQVRGKAPVLIPLGTISSGGGLPDIIQLPFKIITFPLSVYEGVQGILAQIFGGMTGFSIDRLVLKDSTLEIASGVDLERPERARIKNVIDLKKVAIPKRDEIQPSPFEDDHHQK